MSLAMNSHATLPGRLCKHPPTRPRIASPIPSRKGGGGGDYKRSPACLARNYKSRKPSRGCAGARSSTCLLLEKCVTGARGAPWDHMVPAPVPRAAREPWVAGACAEPPVPGKKGLGQKAAEIGRVKYCCRGNVAGHTSRCLAPPGCTVFLPITYLRLPDCNLSSPFGTFAPGDPDPQPRSAAEPSSSGTPGTAEAQPILAPKPI